ncbi:hypothetical protein CWI38_0563p0020 [Hamiltosporidium tvaerminnensis]|uniref:DUF5050 domain-containing protein n=1 Tax=Hamiltosporidium tvaerminnensis TaxID=1176355 RepID=A0A4Q9LZ23_9MICR|nr:hypothetical protein CWI38_0563p0020 [Hamiltosporidium tvaerminnensis]
MNTRFLTKTNHKNITSDTFHKFIALYTIGEKCVDIFSLKEEKIIFKHNFSKEIYNITFSYTGEYIIITHKKMINVFNIYLKKTEFYILKENITECFLLRNKKIFSGENSKFCIFNHLNQEELEMNCDKYYVYDNRYIVFYYNRSVTIMNEDCKILYEKKMDFFVDKNIYYNIFNGKIYFLIQSCIKGTDLNLNLENICENNFPDTFFLTKDVLYLCYMKLNKIIVVNKNLSKVLLEKNICNYFFNYFTGNMIVLDKYGLEIIEYSNNYLKQFEFIYENQIYMEEEDEFDKSDEERICGLNLVKL